MLTPLPYQDHVALHYPISRFGVIDPRFRVIDCSVVAAQIRCVLKRFDRLTRDTDFGIPSPARYA